VIWFGPGFLRVGLEANLHTSSVWGQRIGLFECGFVGCRVVEELVGEFVVVEGKVVGMVTGIMVDSVIEVFEAFMGGKVDFEEWVR
jgi:hypothetical protein